MDGKEFLEDDLTQTIMTQFFSMRMPAEDIADMTGTSAELIEKSIEKINRLHLVMKMARKIMSVIFIRDSSCGRKFQAQIKWTGSSPTGEIF